VGLERGPLSFVSKIEELLGRKSSVSGLENRDYSHRDPSRWPRGTLRPQKFALSSPTSGGRSVGIVRSRLRPWSLVLACLKRDQEGLQWIRNRMLCKNAASVRAKHVGEQLQELNSPSLQQTDVAFVEIAHKDTRTFTRSERSLCSGKYLFCSGKHLASKTKRISVSNGVS
jgi:hypothetical protein